jgi:hypothetical protein
MCHGNFPGASPTVSQAALHMRPEHTEASSGRLPAVPVTGLYRSRRSPLGSAVDKFYFYAILPLEAASYMERYTGTALDGNS